MSPLTLIAVGKSLDQAMQSICSRRPRRSIVARTGFSSFSRKCSTVADSESGTPCSSMRFDAGIPRSATYSVAILREASLWALTITATFSGPRPACAEETCRQTAAMTPTRIFKAEALRSRSGRQTKLCFLCVSVFALSTAICAFEVSLSEIGSFGACTQSARPHLRSHIGRSQSQGK